MSRHTDDDDGFWSAVMADLRIAAAKAKACQTEPPYVIPANEELLRAIMRGEVRDDVPLAQLGIEGPRQEVLFMMLVDARARLGSRVFIRLLGVDHVTVGQVRRCIAWAQQQRSGHKPQRAAHQAPRAAAQPTDQRDASRVEAAPRRRSAGPKAADGGDDPDIKEHLRRREPATAALVLAA